MSDEESTASRWGDLAVAVVALVVCVWFVVQLALGALWAWFVLLLVGLGVFGYLCATDMVTDEFPPSHLRRPADGEDAVHDWTIATRIV